MDRERWLKAAAVLGVLAAVVAGLAAPDWTGQRAARARIAASNRAFDAGRGRIGLVRDLSADPAGQDQAAACLPVQGVVDRALCSSKAYAKR